MFKCGCCEMLVLWFVVWDRIYVFCLYRNPDLNDRIFDCLLTSMAAVQTEDTYASVLFEGDLNCHHQEWLGSTTTNRHGVAAFDFPNWVWLRSVGCRPDPCTWWNTWPPAMVTDVPDLVRVAVVAPTGNSYHSSLSAVISIAQAVPNLYFSRKVFLKH